MFYDPQTDQDLFIAGQVAPPGQYRRLDSDVIIYLDKEDFLPASLDGHVASYTPVLNTWQVISALTPIEASANV